MEGFLCHLVLMVEESVDARSGAGVPNLHALVGRAESDGRKRTFEKVLYFMLETKICVVNLGL